MTRHYKPKEPKREMIRAVQYTYTTTNGRRLARRTVCDLEEETSGIGMLNLERLKKLGKRVFVEK